MWLGSPSTAQAATSPPTAWRAKYPCRPRRVASARPPAPRWLWRTMAPTLVGARVPRARSAPHARARLGCRTSRRVRAGDGPPGTSAPTILPPAPTRPRRWPHNGLAREVPAPPRRVASERLRPGQMVATGGTQFSASVHTGAPPPGTTRRSGKWTATPPRTWGARREISVRNKISSMARIVI